MFWSSTVWHFIHNLYHIAKAKATAKMMVIYYNFKHSMYTKMHAKKVEKPERSLAG